MKNKTKVYYCEGLPSGISQHSLAYLLLEKALREEYPEADWRNPKFGRTEYGKPYLSNHPNIQFNISHCSAGVTCALADVPVGVDMEMRFGWKEKLAQRMCHPEEFAWLMQLDAIKEREQQLNRIWSRKESWLKCLGIGLRRDLRECKVTGTVMTECERAAFARQWQFWEHQNERFTLVLCRQRPQKAPEGLFLPEKDLVVRSVEWQDLLGE